MGGSNSFVFKSDIGCRNPLWTKFRYYELDEIMRQQGQIAFCNALNNMAEGTMTEEDILLMESRKLSHTNKPPADAVWLFSTNKACKEYNDAFQNNLGTEGIISVAHDVVTGNQCNHYVRIYIQYLRKSSMSCLIGSTSASNKQRFLEEGKSLTPQKSDGIPYETNLQVGATYFVSTNLDVSDGLFNGATGILRKIECGKNAKKEKVPTVAWMEFTNVLIGSSLRERSSNLIEKCNASPTWTPILRTTRELSVSNREGSMKLRRTQIPLVSANAITIHKVSDLRKYMSTLFSVNH